MVRMKNMVFLCYIPWYWLIDEFTMVFAGHVMAFKRIQWHYHGKWPPKPWHVTRKTWFCHSMHPKKDDITMVRVQKSWYYHSICPKNSSRNNVWYYRGTEWLLYNLPWYTWCLHPFPVIYVLKPIIPNDVVVVSQVELLRVFSGVVHHSNSGHKIHDLLPGGVVQVIPALMSSVSVNPLQPQLTARSRLLRHALGICDRLQVTDVSFSWPAVDFLQGTVSLGSRWWITSCMIFNH